MYSDKCNKAPSSFSLHNLFRLRIFETLYATGNSDTACEDDGSTSGSGGGGGGGVSGWFCGSGGGSGEASAGRHAGAAGGSGSGRYCADRQGAGDATAADRKGRYEQDGYSDPSKRNYGDRGKTGAGLAGSRTGPRRLGDPVMAGDNLPFGATNPGLLRYIHNAARYRLPQCFEGGILSVKQRSKNNWLLGHTLSFSSVSPGGYKVLLSYQDPLKPAMPPYFVMEAAPGGQMSCEVRVGPTRGTRATAIAQIADAELYSFESMFDIYLNAATASVIAVNKEFIALHYLQAFTRNLSLGGELVARGPATELSSASGALRWANLNNSVSATLGNRGLDICYARNLKPFLTTAAMLEVGFAIRRAVATLAYEWRSDMWTARASIDSDGLVGATLERALGGKNADLSCAISALLNHPNDKFRLGFALNAAIV